MNLEKPLGIEKHPCYDVNAQNTFSRMHLPVAPACNIQCNYCNRKFDCSNESRPGVTSEILSPKEAIEKISQVKEKIFNLSVIGIAGPGDPLANEETFETIQLVKEKFPELILCLSTNGLLLYEKQKILYELGVRFVTVTMNAFAPETGSKIYSKVIWEGKKYAGIQASKILIENQKKGIEECSKLGMMVKVNIVMIPEINIDEIPEIVKSVKKLGAQIVNILPLIPVQNTAFEKLRAPTPNERKQLIDQCRSEIKMMRHCRQCRADAIGMLDNDQSGKFQGCVLKQGGCGPIDIPDMPSESIGKYAIAVASSAGKNVDRGLGNAESFFIYTVKNNEIIFEKKISTESLIEDSIGSNHRNYIEKIAESLSECKIVIVSEIGDMPRAVLESKKIKVITSKDTVRNAISSVLTS